MENFDNDIKNIMKLSQVMLPSENFEQQVMRRIDRIAAEKNFNIAQMKTDVWLLITIFLVGIANVFLFGALQKQSLTTEIQESITLISLLIYIILIISFAIKIQDLVDSWKSRRSEKLNSFNI